MRIVFFLLFVSIGMSFNKANAQNDTTKVQDDLLSSLSTDSANVQKLLPDHILITQRLLWGNKGLMRNFNRFELTPENRAHELKVRRTMLVCHQAMGALTVLGLIGQGIIGSQLYNGKESIRDLHEGFAMGVNITYGTTAALSLFSPPKMLNERKGYSSIKIHRALAIVHMSSMIATNILAGQIESHPELKNWHRAAAFTWLGSLVAAELIIKF